MFSEMKKRKSLLIVISFVFAGTLLPSDLSAETVIEQWVATYNGPGNGVDFANAVAVDASGNVYVTGQSWGSTTDSATVKYDSSGNQVWLARYNGTSDNSDYAVDIAVDSSNNIYVVGGNGTHDFLTIKYEQIVDPAMAIEDLVATVISLNLKNGISNSLDAKLGASLNALDDVNANNNVAAINTLEAFISSVEAQRGKEISETDADSLIQLAINIINMLSSP